MNIKLVFRLLGNVMLVDGAAMLPSVFVALLYHEGDWWPLLTAAALASATGFALTRLRPSVDTLRAREGFVTVALCWVVLSFFGCLPFYIGGYIPSLVDSFFECVSGYTTTGATILTDLEKLPHGILFWRSFTHWIGGMGVLVLSLALLPKMGARSLHLLRAESPGPTPGKLVPKTGKTAKILYMLYLALTLIEVLVLLLCGMNLFDSLIHAFGTAGTGGFSNYSLSVGHFNSPAIDNMISVFMLLFGVNFSVFYFLLHGGWRQALGNEELRAYGVIVGVSVMLIAIDILPVYNGSVADALRYSLFQVSSIITTTGYATADFNLWPQFSRTILVGLMLIGACAGSTGGGLKVIRVTLLGKGVRREIHNAMRPRGVEVVRAEGRAVEENVLAQVQAFFFAYMLVIAAATLVVSLDNFDFETNLTSVISAVSNIGPGLGMTGPMGSFASFSPRSKIVLSLCMLIGRLEIYPILMLFFPAVWKRG